MLVALGAGYLWWQKVKVAEKASRLETQVAELNTRLEQQSVSRDIAETETKPQERTSAQKDELISASLIFKSVFPRIDTRDMIGRAKLMEKSPHLIFLGNGILSIRSGRIFSRIVADNSQYSCFFALKYFPLSVIYLLL